MSTKAKSRGIPQSSIAELVGRSPRTIRGWKHEGARMQARPRGRKPVRSSLETRRRLLASFDELGPEAGVVVYQALHPSMARREVEDMVKRFRKVCRRRKPKPTEEVCWTRAARVWAVDHSHTPRGEEQTRIALACRDLGSHQQIIWEESRETAERTVAQLEESFLEHGAPLVLKSDGGPAFRSREYKVLLERYGVEALPSPGYYPEYNGSCEAANGSMKRRTNAIAARNGREDAWMPWDLELARMQANHTARPWGLHGPVPAERWRKRRSISCEERQAFRQSCAQLREAVIAERELGQEELEKESIVRSVQRTAVRRALVEHGLLIIQRRLIRPPIHTVRTA